MKKELGITVALVCMTFVGCTQSSNSSMNTAAQSEISLERKQLSAKASQCLVDNVARYSTTGRRDEAEISVRSCAACSSDFDRLAIKIYEETGVGSIEAALQGSRVACRDLAQSLATEGVQARNQARQRTTQIRLE